MTLPILTVVGALGAQGGSVVSAFTKDSESQYHVRALTSSPTSPTALELSKKSHVSIVSVDLNSVESLVKAFEGSALIFANTAFPPQVFMSEGPAAAQRVEASQGLNIMHAAAQTTALRHLIWSTLPNGMTVSQGKYDIPHFQSKIPAEEYAQSKESGLAAKTTFLRVGMYGSNITRPPYTPTHADAAQKVIFMLPCAPDTPIPFIGNETVNVGLMVKDIFAQPDKTQGRFVLGSAETITCRDWATAHAKAQQHAGKKTETVFVECSLDAFEEIWGPVGTEIGVMFKYLRETGYSGFTAGTRGWPILEAKDLGLGEGLRTTESHLVELEQQRQASE